MRNKITIIVMVAATSISTLIFVPRAKAQDLVIDPANLVQNVILVTQKIEELQSMIQQVRSYAEQIKDWKFSDVLNTLSRMGSLKNQININEEHLNNVLDKLPEEWKDVDLQKLKDFRDQKLKDARDRTEEFLKTQDVVAKNAEKIKDQVQKYVSKSNAASGALSAIQAGNEMMAATISQLQDMQGLELSGLQAEIEKAAVKRAEEAWDQAYNKIAAESQKFLADN